MPRTRTTRSSTCQWNERDAMSIVVRTRASGCAEDVVEGSADEHGTPDKQHPPAFSGLTTGFTTFVGIAVELHDQAGHGHGSAEQA
jgi:hypothetical protein